MKPYLPLSLALLLAACGNKTEGTNPAASTTPPPSSAPAAASLPNLALSAAALASAAAGVADAVQAAAGASETWKGTAKSKVGAVTLSKEASEAVKVWAKDPGTAHIGDCSLTLKVSGGKVRAVSGEITGALGNLTISGEIDGNDLRARVDPREPNAPDAMTGILKGTVKDGAIEATLSVANRNANVVREAEFKLAK